MYWQVLKPTLNQLPFSLFRLNFPTHFVKFYILECKSGEKAITSAGILSENHKMGVAKDI